MTEVVWSDPAGPATDHLKLQRNGDGFVADGLCIAHGEAGPCRLHYVIHIDPGWRMRSVELRILDGGETQAELSLSVDDSHSWRNGDGRAVTELDGCHEIDLACTPFTRTLAIRRLALQLGESAEISVARVDVPALTVRPVRQRYRCIEPLGPDGGRFGHEALAGGEAAELPVDSDGLVMDYPDGFRRVWASQDGQ